VFSNFKVIIGHTPNQNEKTEQHNASENCGLNTENAQILMQPDQVTTVHGIKSEPCGPTFGTYGVT